MSEEENNEISDEEAIMKIAAAMKDNAPLQEDKYNIHTFLFSVIQEKDIDFISKVGNLRQDKDLDELGIPTWTVRGSLEMSNISDKIMDNTFFKDYFDQEARITLMTSLSREGFVIRQGTTQTKQVADVTKRKKTNKGLFKKTEEVSGGDTTLSGG